jgi:hypothetical protein
MKGTTSVPDTEIRWHSIVKAAGRFGLVISPKLVVSIEGSCSTPHLG